MSQLKSHVDDTDLHQITTPAVLHILRTIKQIQKRMKDPDMVNLEYPRVYDTLSKEFDDFFNKHTSIFIKVTRGENLDILASCLYYKDQVAKGLITEAEVADMVAGKFFTPDLKAESDAKLAEMKKKEAQTQ